MFTSECAVKLGEEVVGASGKSTKFCLSVLVPNLCGLSAHSAPLSRDRGMHHPYKHVILCVPCLEFS